MPVARTRAMALLGLSGSPVDVEADLSAQLPALVIIGLADTALSEARERVRSAAINAGCPLPARRLTVNLSPATLPKHGSSFDLAIALACLGAADGVDRASIEHVVHLGELALDGRLRPVDGVLPAVLAARNAGFDTVMVPVGNREEAELVAGVRVVAVAGLREAVEWHGGPVDGSAGAVEPILREQVPESLEDAGDLADVAGNAEAVEALVAAAAGGHHLSMIGPPGAGKTMLAARLPALLPDLAPEQALEVASIRSLGGRAVGAVLPSRPPLESPHHTASSAAMAGGGSRVIRPGAVTRAAHGVLFLDEAPEFPARVLDVLRQPLESGVIEIHRSNAVARFPASFQLVLASNPCPCGQYGAPGDGCTCPPLTRRRYLGRLSGPLLDRVDIRLVVRRVSAADLREQGAGVTTAEARRRVAGARGAAAERLSATPWRTNARVPGPWLRTPGGMRLAPAATRRLDQALERGGITMRGYDRVIRLAWTLADLDGATSPAREHVGRALALREAAAA
ncbi:hypothetical protein ARHIZOSPH14_29060 [Agromyces rhizosphaerae]|uniref:AAA+ ATPase domain-containing protein n=1 Tax=Agromyces rhizosphaerae TaxID=88374 RepID=A0A9W6FQ35_9MICO|nr:YifB family Mg chelatase-like AAA ATPase [Agromyces rhizosphaerae]GLI28664.1 hypothetical protein ARHIZOSPH14_29060 [Agromyces rhizosphaerae]